MDVLSKVKAHYFALVVIFVCSTLWIYFYTRKGVCKSKASLDGKTVIITGGNSGIGKATAFDLARRGARVIIACTNLERSHSVTENIVKETKNENVEVKFVDLSHLTSVRRFAAEVTEGEPRLDVLIHNAGVLLPRQATTPEGLDGTLAVNVFGPFLLTHLLIDLLKKTGKSRIVIVASSAHILASVDPDNPMPSEDYHKTWHRIFTGFKIYCMSKFAEVLITREMARRLESSGVTVNCLHPGFVGSSIAWNPFSPTALRLLAFFFPLLKTNEEGAQTSIYLAVSEDVEGVTGKYFSNCKEKSPAKLTDDEALAKKYWEVCKKVVDLQPSEPQI